MVHRFYKLKNDHMSLRDYYQVMKSTKDQTSVGYDVIVAEFVNKWLKLPLIVMLLMPITGAQIMGW